MKSRVGVYIAAFLVSVGATPLASAKSSVGLLFKGSSSLKGFELDGTADLDRSAVWEGDLTYAYTTSDIGGQQSATNLISLGATRTLDPASDLQGLVNLWDDTVNKIHYAGPSMTYNHLWFNGKDESTGESWGLTLEGELYFYGADDVSVTGTGKPAGRGSGAATTITRTTTVTTTQFHPSATVEKPFLEELLVPYLSAGHYFYSSDPATLESKANRVGVRVSQTSLAGIDSMVGGFIRNSWALGTRIYFADGWNLKVELGRDQLETDGSWASVYSARLTHSFSDHVRGAVGWNHSVQDAEPVDYGLVNLVYVF